MKDITNSGPRQGLNLSIYGDDFTRDVGGDFAFVVKELSPRDLSHKNFSGFDRLYVPRLTDPKPTQFAPLGRNQVHRAGEAGVEEIEGSRAAIP